MLDPSKAKRNNYLLHILFIIIVIVMQAFHSAAGTIRAHFNDPSTVPLVNQVLGINVQSNNCGRAIGASLTHLGMGPRRGEDSLYIMAYNLNDSSLIARLIQAARRGVTIKILINEGGFDLSLQRPVQRYNAEDWTNDPSGLLKKIRVRTLRGRGQYGVMHHKVMIMNMAGRRRALYFGSFNFSNNAAKYNYENCAKVEHAHNVVAGDQLRSMADTFQAKFDQLWTLGRRAGRAF